MGEHFVAKSLKLVNKLKRREKDVQSSMRGRKYPKVDKRSETLSDSPGTSKALRKSQRRLDRSFGADFCAHEPLLSQKIMVDNITRTDFDPGAGTDFGLLLTLSPMVAGEVAEQTKITTVGDVQGVAEETDITTVADSSGSLGGTYFLYDTPANSYYVWFDVDDGSADPAVGGRTGVEVNISADDADTVVAAALQSAMDGLGDVTASVLGATVTATNDAAGDVADAVDNDTGFTIATTVQGVDEDTLNDAYFLLSSPDTDYYVWFNVDAGGTDPMVAGRTGIEVGISGDDDDEAVAAALAAALDAESDFSASDSTNMVTVLNANGGAAPDAEDGAVPTGFSFAVQVQGLDLNTLGIIAGDVLQLLTGSAAGKWVKVVSLLNGSQMRLEDIADFDSGDDGSEDDVWVNFELSSVKASYV